MSPIITLSTDFGYTDPYVGIMKGIILSRCPSAKIVDVSHGIPAFSILSGAYTIAQACHHFPHGTIHVVVVDPNTGAGRLPILAEIDGHLYVAPDNGVLSLVAQRQNTLVHEISDARKDHNPVTCFPCIVGGLASGTLKPRNIGPRMESFVKLPSLSPTELGDGKFGGIVLSVDHFGNIVTNFKSCEFSALRTHSFSLDVNGKTVHRFFKTYACAPPQECFVYPGDSGFVEVAVNQGKASDYIKTEIGSPVSLIYN